MTSLKKNGIYFCHTEKVGKDGKSFENSIMSTFGYIDDNKNKVRRMVKDILSPALGRPAEHLEDLLLFGSVEECIQKIMLSVKQEQSAYTSGR